MMGGMAAPDDILEAERGSPFTAEFLLYDDEAQTIPTDLTAGWGGVFEVRSHAGAEGDPLIHADSEQDGGLLVLAPPDEDDAPIVNLIRLYLPAVATLAPRADPDLAWELVLVNDAEPQFSPLPVAAGTFVLGERTAVVPAAEVP